MKNLKNFLDALDPSEDVLDSYETYLFVVLSL
jgi:hypothetical protein